MHTNAQTHTQYNDDLGCYELASAVVGQAMVYRTYVSYSWTTSLGFPNSHELQDEDELWFSTHVSCSMRRSCGAGCCASPRSRRSAGSHGSRRRARREPRGSRLRPARQVAAAAARHRAVPSDPADLQTPARSDEMMNPRICSAGRLQVVC